jgi:hypothetical protein
LELSPLPSIIGHGKVFLTETEGNLDETLKEIQKKYSQEIFILDIRLDINDVSNAIQRLIKDICKKIK